MNRLQKQHWIFRVGDGKNFQNSKHPFWGVKRGRGNCIKTIVEKINEGDILWFLTSKPHGGKFIGMAEYTVFYDRNDEPLVKLNTFSNEEQGWDGIDDWDIQIHYKKLYETERQNIFAIIQNSSIILKYESCKNKIEDDLIKHYENFKFYAEPKI